VVQNMAILSWFQLPTASKASRGQQKVSRGRLGWLSFGITHDTQRKLYWFFVSFIRNDNEHYPASKNQSPNRIDLIGADFGGLWEKK
jgi:hypothetical protein